MLPILSMNKLCFNRTKETLRNSAIAITPAHYRRNFLKLKPMRAVLEGQAYLLYIARP